MLQIVELVVREVLSSSSSRALSSEEFMQDFPFDNEQQQKNNYTIDTESGTEMARLLDLDQLATQSMGGFLPQGISLAANAYVLDVACGPGGWVQQLAFAYPEVQVTGIDISRRMIEYAREHARVQGLDNAHFYIMDASGPLNFSDQSFDVINMRLALGFMLPTQWPSFLQEAIRITKAGGSVCLTEAEGFGISTSPAFERLNAMMIQSLHLAHRTYHPLGHAIGITPKLRQFLQEAGFQHIQTRANGLDFSAGMPAHSLTCKNILVALQLLKPFFLQVAVTTAEEFEQLIHQTEIELYSPTFSGICYGISTWGTTPL
jgi:ubiquinone/menaquinone biosynthesis C-methylase UbiE